MRSAKINGLKQGQERLKDNRMSTMINVNGEEFHWQLPMASAEHNNTGYIHGNAKPHLFGEDGWCLCHKYCQDISCVDDIKGIYDDEMMSDLFCKSCFKKMSSLRKRQS